MKEKTLYQLSITELRYSQDRDNHLAPFTAALNIKECIEEMGKNYKLLTIRQVRSEIDLDLRCNERKEKDIWLRLYVELGNMEIKINNG